VSNAQHMDTTCPHGPHTSARAPYTHQGTPCPLSHPHSFSTSPSLSTPSHGGALNSSSPLKPSTTPDDDADELFHHLGHLFLAGDQGEGHPQAFPSSSSSPKQGGQARAAPSPHHHLQDPTGVALVAGELIPSLDLSPLP